MATMSIAGLYEWDDTLFKPLIDKIEDFYPYDTDALQIEILAECAEFETLYTDPDFFKLILGAWADGIAPKWKRQIEAIEAKYNITENYDRSEEWTDTGNSTSNNSNKAKGYPVTSGMIKQTETEGETNGTSTHTGRVHGNIGVRSAQELVEQELSLADKVNVQKIIVTDFKKRFCLLMY